MDRYVGRHVVGGSAIALAVLVALFSVVGFVDDVESVGRGDYDLLRAMENLVLRIPGRVFSLLPVSALIGSLIGLGILASGNELTVFRAAGVSANRLTGSVLKSGAILVALAVVVGELVVPWTEQAAHERRSVAINQQLDLPSGSGLWIRDGLSFINIRRVLPDSRLADVHIYEFDADRKLRVATYARGATYRPKGGDSGGDGGGEWALEGIRQSTITSEGVTSQTMERALWRSLLAPDQVNAVQIKPEGLSMIGLIRYSRFLGENGLSTTRYEYALWNKLVYPLATGVMVFVSVILVLGPLSGVSLGRRIVIGIAIGMVFHIVQQAAMHMGLVFEGNPLLTVLGPTLFFLGFGIWLMRRVG